MIHGLVSTLTGAWQSIAGVSPGVLVLAVAFHLAKLSAEARSWHWIVRHAHGRRHVSFRTTFGAFVGSIGANAILPARVGETLRVGVVRRRVPDSSVITIAATVVLEMGIEVAFGAAVIAAVILAGRSFGSGTPTLALPGLVSNPVVLVVAACVGVVTVGLGLSHRKRARDLFARMAEGFSIVKDPRAFVAQVMSWKLVAWAFRLASVYAFLLAFHVPAAPWTALVVVAAQNVAASIPLLPGNVGTQQAAIGVALAGSATGATVLGFGLGMQAATVIADLVVGTAALVMVANRGDLRHALAALRLRRGADTAIAG